MLIKNITLGLRILLSLIFIFILGAVLNTVVFTRSETMSCFGEKYISKDNLPNYHHEFRNFWFGDIRTTRHRVINFKDRSSIFGPRVLIGVGKEWANACGVPSEKFQHRTYNLTMTTFNNQIFCSFDWEEGMSKGNTNIRWNFSDKLISGDYFYESKKDKKRYNFDFEVYCQ